MDRGISAFNTLSFFEFKENWYTQIKQEVTSKAKEYILQVDDDEFANYLYEKYSLTPLAIDFNSESVQQPIKKKEIVQDRFNRSYEVDEYHFTVKYNYLGSGVLFNVRPNPSAMTSNQIYVDSNNGTVSFKFIVD